MSDDDNKPISIDEARIRRLPVQTHLNVQDADATRWVGVLYNPRGKPTGMVGLDFGPHTIPIAMTSDQARILATRLFRALRELEAGK